jgi:hypothetical protein
MEGDHDRSQLRRTGRGSTGSTLGSTHRLRVPLLERVGVDIVPIGSPGETMSR